LTASAASTSLKPRHSDEVGTMNDASGDQKDVYPIGKRNPTLPFYRPFAPVTSSSSPGRSPRIPTGI
jgi:hypothetical protein